MASCQDSYNPERTFKTIEDQLQRQFISVKDSSVIEIPEGHFLFERSLIMDGKRHITIRGAGMDKTVLSFKGQLEGAEGIKITNSEHVVIEDLTVEDAAGDNIKVSDTYGITFRRVKVAWTGKIDSDNGAYGIYPVICKHVLVEECEALGSSDAGIYVGQSDSVIIRNNKAYMNVAGIESENCNYVQIYGNESFDNSGGLLIFDLPGLTQYGSKIEAWDNYLHDNNRDNFAPEGTIVGFIPAGTGLIVLATSEVDLHDNRIENNKTLQLGMISYVLVNAITEGEEGTDAVGSAQRINRNYLEDTGYDPFCNRVYIHQNRFKNDKRIPDLGHDFGRLFLWKFKGKTPDIIYDGLYPEDFILSDGKVNPAREICISENEDARFADLDASNDFEALSFELGYFDCP
jgi:parallel beta-helix repeat protein